MTKYKRVEYEELFQKWIFKYHNIHDNGTIEIVDVNRKKAFLAGTEHAHPIGFNLGKEEGKVEGWNDCIKMIEEERNILQNTGSLMWHKPDEQKKTLQISECLSITLKYIEELKKLKR